MDRGSKTVFAECFLAASGSSIEERKQYTYADKRYQDYLKKWDECEKKMVQARVEYDSIKTNFEALQSALSFDKEAMKRNI